MAEQTLEAGPLWRLRLDVVSARILLWFAGAGRIGEPTPGAHLYLADRYSWLANRYSARGQFRKAKRYEAKWAWHLRAAGHDPSPRSVAIAMPIPSPPTFVDAVARGTHSEDPDDVA